MRLLAGDDNRDVMDTARARETQTDLQREGKKQREEKKRSGLKTRKEKKRIKQTSKKSPPKNTEEKERYAKHTESLKCETQILQFCRHIKS